ncbi:MAG: flagellar biosynthesis protein FlhA [Henriciella sp.]|jgi:flagellar biosynthesis protein FlhA
MTFKKLVELSSPTAILAIGLMMIILIMILPVPSWVLDIGLTVSFAFAILIFVTAIFIERPLDFSSFPSVLLASLMLRLALNVSSTKLIISEGHTGTAAAGGVIEGFAMFIMGGNLFVGLVVFGVLIIVNFMVITKGAGRMAEVGARFALDAMPGKQLAIDSDLAVGAITHDEAKRRREKEQEEASFLGSLDGASKFVKGDAIAGLLITALNLLAGIGFGLSMHQLTLTEALNNYSVLTVGDGLVSQIPALIVSVSAALLLSKGRDDGAIDGALGIQLGTNATPLGLVAGILMTFAVFPGLPFLPFMIASVIFGVLAYFAHKREQLKGVTEIDAEKVETTKAANISDSIHADEIHLEVAQDLVGVVLQGENGIEARIDKIRRYIAEEYGFILPPIRMTDNPVLEKNTYRFKIQGIRVDSGFVRPGSVLALIEDDQLKHISGEAVREPVYKAAARWVRNGKKQELSVSSIPFVEPIEVLATHMLEIIQNNFELIFTRIVMLETLDALSRISDDERAIANQRVLDEYIPGKVSPELLLSVLRALLVERVPVRNLLLIIEAIAEAKQGVSRLDQILELVRQRLSFQILDRVVNEQGKLPLLQLSPKWEERFIEFEVRKESGESDIALPPELFAELTNGIQYKLSELAQTGVNPAIATSSRRRKFVHTVISSKGIRNMVVAYEEIGSNSKPQIYGVV